MLNFDQDRFLRIQAGALAQAEGIHRTIGGYLEAGAANLFFLGSGGAGILMMPAVQLLQDRSTLPVHLRLPAELVELGSVHLGPQSIVVIASLSGTTKESVKALSYCQDRGAKVVTLTGHADTPLADLADDNFLNFAEDDTSCGQPASVVAGGSFGAAPPWRRALPMTSRPWNCSRSCRTCFSR